MLNKCSFLTFHYCCLYIDQSRHNKSFHCLHIFYSLRIVCNNMFSFKLFSCSLAYICHRIFISLKIAKREEKSIQLKQSNLFTLSIYSKKRGSNMEIQYTIGGAIVLCTKFLGNKKNFA